MPKYQGAGTTLKFNSVLVGGIRSISLPDAARGEIDVTDMDSAAREFIPGRKDFGQVTIECWHDPEDLGQIELVSNFNAAGNATQDVIITVADAAADLGVHTLTFDAFVLSMPGTITGEADEAASRTFTLRVTGAVSEATA
jgi:hypothetical protein